ncbi:MAG: hypothetical protein ACLFSV_11900 [Alkalispirochaeta sp.]
MTTTHRSAPPSAAPDRRLAGPRRALLALTSAIAVLPFFPQPLVAQEYEFLGTVELTSVTGHYKDSPVVAVPDDRDTWETDGLILGELQHRFILDEAEFFLDHAIGAYPASATALDGGAGAAGTFPTATTGGAGTGDAAAATVALVHDLYQGYASVHPAPWFTLRAGRQRMNWGTAWTFSVTDALHPQNPDAEVQTGFDGVSVALRPVPEFSFEFATAIQNAVATRDTADIRYGLYGIAFIAPVELGATLVYQNRTTLRPGVVGSVPIGPVMLVAEGAIEAYDPRGEQMDYQPLWSVGGEYTWHGTVTDLSLMTEYLYNGLAEHYPETAFGDISVTSDYAGGFARRGYRYLAAGATLTVLDSWATSHQLLANLTDESYYVSHSLSMLRIPRVDLEAEVTWNSGKAGTEFGDLDRDMIVAFRTVVHL